MIWLAIAAFCLIVGLYAAVEIWQGMGDERPRVEAMHDQELEQDWRWSDRTSNNG